MKTIEIPDEKVWPEVKLLIIQSNLTHTIDKLIEKHGGLRPTARALQIDPSYLLRLKRNERSPSEKILKKLGLKKVIGYVEIKK